MSIDHLLLLREPGSGLGAVFAPWEWLETVEGPSLPVCDCATCGRWVGGTRLAASAKQVAALASRIRREVVDGPAWLRLQALVADTLGRDPHLVSSGDWLGPPVARALRTLPPRFPQVFQNIAGGTWVSAGVADEMLRRGIDMEFLERIRWSGAPPRKKGASGRPSPEARVGVYFEVTCRASVHGVSRAPETLPACAECGRLLIKYSIPRMLARESWNGDPFALLEWNPGRILVSPEVASILQEVAPGDVSFRKLKFADAIRRKRAP